ncbi:hypothetical protein WS99_10195 [Burkholderia territorii]|uniref:hypothetical protein n=1 Tax=Burkholderia territorii TaxID=1503055 RepID=UPI0007568AD3|nr:hypothetical protein [Burkholderia territorii]KVL55212.1 hypothetical protein WS99_10195 [Burkholderia territorii]
MVKTLAACAALCIAAVAFPRFHESAASLTAPAPALPTDAGRVDANHAAVAEPGIAPSANDGNAALQAAAAQGAGKLPVAALGVANAGWSDLFNH